MKLSIDYNTARYTINSYEPGNIQVNNQSYEKSLIITPESLHLQWNPGQIDDLTEVHIDAILELKPEIILLGTGTTLKFPGQQLMIHALTKGVGIEVMDTGAACRTYNVLSAEDRNVAAALIIG